MITHDGDCQCARCNPQPKKPKPPAPYSECLHNDIYCASDGSVRCVRWDCRVELPDVRLPRSPDQAAPMCFAWGGNVKYWHSPICAAVTQEAPHCTCGARKDEYSAAAHAKAKQVEHHAGCALKEKTGHFCTCGADPQAMHKFTTPGGLASLPTPYESELITIGMEEAVEVLEELHRCLTAFHKRCAKGLRFGLDQVEPGQQESNRVRLAKEAGQLNAVLGRMVTTHILPGTIVSAAGVDKLMKLQQYMQRTPEEQR